MVYRAYNLEDEELSSLIQEQMTNLNFMNLKFQIKRLNSRTGQWTPTSVFKIKGLPESVILFLLNKKYIFVKHQALSVRFFV